MSESAAARLHQLVVLDERARPLRIGRTPADTLLWTFAARLELDAIEMKRLDRTFQSFFNQFRIVLTDHLKTL